MAALQTNLIAASSYAEESREWYYYHAVPLTGAGQQQPLQQDGQQRVGPVSKAEIRQLHRWGSRMPHAGSHAAPLAARLPPFLTPRSIGALARCPLLLGCSSLLLQLWHHQRRHALLDGRHARATAAGGCAGAAVVGGARNRWVAGQDGHVAAACSHTQLDTKPRPLLLRPPCVQVL